ncbi:TniQ family protein [Paraburkholderia sediminicola]|uniref:TniQ family protein n=1 Tax=Paraburkholderia sediminicola TaxID=458836 RepID=UPI0038B8DC76
MTGAEVPLEGNRSEADTAVSLCSGKNDVEPMTLCAPAIPGESLISQVSRYHVTSGNVTTRDTYDELFQRAPFRLTFWVPPHIASLSVWLKGELVETTHRLLRESTLFPLFKMFNGARFAPSASRESVDEALRRQPKRIVAESGWTRICPLCVIKDSEKYGTAVIRSAHQIPGVSHCHSHGTPLQDWCQKCRCPFERKNDLVLTPWLGCAVCEARLVGDPSQTEAVPDDSRAIGFARFAARLLE